MNENRNLKNQDLVSKAKTLVTEERRITLTLIDCLEEISRRMIYAELGYGSLFEFCTRHLNLSEGSAHRRISAMRLSRDVPTAREKLKSGELTLSNAAKIQIAMKRIKSSDTNNKMRIVQECSNLSQKECEIKLFAFIPELKQTITYAEKTRVIDETHTEIKLLLGAELKSKIDQLHNLLSHQNPEKSYIKLFDRLVTQELEKEQKRHSTQIKHKPTNSAAEPLPLTTDKSIMNNTNSTDNNTKHGRVHLSAKIRKQVWTRAKIQCQYAECGSTYQLQVDHKVPVALGGSNQIENLTLLCRTHNLFRAREALGSEKMKKYIPNLQD